MNCAGIENLICDYVDGTLAPGPRGEVERHLADCLACAELARDAAAAVEFMQRAAEVEPPQQLVSQILFHSPWRRYKSGWFWQPFHALLRPKFALSMALTILSLAMVMPKLLKVRQLQPRDLAPAQVWANLEDRGYRLWARTQKFYDNLKFVYQIQSTLREWQQQSQSASPGTETPAYQSPSTRPAPPAPPEQSPAGKT
jgi:anti-sigma factor RsiW